MARLKAAARKRKCPEKDEIPEKEDVDRSDAEEEEDDDEEQEPEEEQPKPRGKPGRRVGYRKGVVPPKKRTRDTIIQSRCTVSVAMEFLHTKVIPKLTPSQINLLVRTPFFHLFGLPNNMKSCLPLLHSILLKWDIRQKCFVHEAKKVSFCEEDVCLVMGFGQGGSGVFLSKENSKSSKLHREYFKAGLMSREKLKDVIMSLIGREGNPVLDNDVIGLVIMYLFTFVMFPQGNGCVPVQLFHYLDDLSTLKKYSWGRAVYEVLAANIPKCAAWCQGVELGTDSDDQSTQDSGTDAVARKKGKNVKKKKSKKASSSRRSLPGCSVALMTVFLERFDFEKLCRNRGRIPRYNNWYFDKCYSRRTLSKMIDEIPNSKVKPEPLVALPTEEEFLVNGVKCSRLADLIRSDEDMRMHSITNLSDLAVKLSPVFFSFGFEVCDYVIEAVNVDELEELEYVLVPRTCQETRKKLLILAKRRQIVPHKKTYERKRKFTDGQKIGESADGQNSQQEGSDGQNSQQQRAVGQNSQQEWADGQNSQEKNDQNDGSGSRKTPEGKTGSKKGSHVEVKSPNGKKSKNADEQKLLTPDDVVRVEYNSVTCLARQQHSSAPPDNSAPSFSLGLGLLQEDDVVLVADIINPNALKEHELLVETSDYESFFIAYVATEPLPEIAFKKNLRSEIGTSIYFDPYHSVAVPRAKMNYPGRLLSSARVCKLVDLHLEKFNEKKLIGDTVIYSNYHVSCDINDLKSIL